jgi:hypothetical protein
MGLRLISRGDITVLQQTQLVTDLLTDIYLTSEKKIVYGVNNGSGRSLTAIH